MQMQRIAILSSASEGGAGIAARRLWSGLTAVTAMQVDFVDIATVGEGLPASVTRPGSCSNGLRTNTHFTGEVPGFVRGWMVSMLDNYDFINVHWASFLVSVSELIAIARLGKPMLITMHDLFYTTGGCHYPAGCTGQSRGCMTCPQVNAAKFAYTDVMRAFADKKYLLSFENVHISAPSAYMVGTAVKAGLVPPGRAHVIRNIFEAPLPVEGLENRDRAKHILIIAASFGERRKGAALAISALAEFVKIHPDIVIHIVGNTDGQTITACKSAGLTVVNHGRVDDERSLAKVYQSVGILLTCSYEDNWPNILVEAGSYGVVPVVGSGHGCEEFCRTFDVGVVVQQYTPTAFASGINACTARYPSGDRLRRYAQAVRTLSSADMVVRGFSSALETYNNQDFIPVAITTTGAEDRIVSENYLRTLKQRGEGFVYTGVRNGPFAALEEADLGYGLRNFVIAPAHQSVVADAWRSSVRTEAKAR